MVMCPTLDCKNEETHCLMRDVRKERSILLTKFELDFENFELNFALFNMDSTLFEPDLLLLCIDFNTFEI